jgi:hypothetical protein
MRICLLLSLVTLILRNGVQGRNQQCVDAGKRYGRLLTDDECQEYLRQGLLEAKSPSQLPQDLVSSQKDE